MRLSASEFRGMNGARRAEALRELADASRRTMPGSYVEQLRARQAELEHRVGQSIDAVRQRLAAGTLAETSAVVSLLMIVNEIDRVSRL